jgi:hypothetical protein
MIEIEAGIGIKLTAGASVQIQGGIIKLN